MRPLLFILLAVTGLSGCARDEGGISAGEQILAAHFDALRRGDTNAVVARYSTEFFSQPKQNREQLAASLGRLHALGLRDYTIVDREVRDEGGGIRVRLSCRTRYGSSLFNEEFDLYLASGSTNFVIIRHDFD